MLVAALLAGGNLIGNPSPFVLLSFSVGALPLWTRVRRPAFIVGLCVPASVAALPVVLLARYGSGEGGISGWPAIARAGLTLGLLSYGLASLGLGIGRLVWMGRLSHAKGSPATI